MKQKGLNPFLIASALSSRHHNSKTWEQEKLDPPNWRKINNLDIVSSLVQVQSSQLKIQFFLLKLIKLIKVQFNY